MMRVVSLDEIKTVLPKVDLISDIETGFAS